ncbi:hypothetical protein DIPPA_30769 [Diplonema papillatum]|nr:hypothetical protein DIPPA_30769 [Diplonema papillatum]
MNRKRVLRREPTEPLVDRIKELQEDKRQLMQQIDDEANAHAVAVRDLRAHIAGLEEGQAALMDKYKAVARDIKQCQALSPKQNDLLWQAVEELSAQQLHIGGCLSKTPPQRNSR